MDVWNDSIGEIEDQIDYLGFFDLNAEEFVNKQGYSKNREFYINKKGVKVPIKKLLAEEKKVIRDERKQAKREKKIKALMGKPSKSERGRIAKEKAARKVARDKLKTAEKIIQLNRAMEINMNMRYAPFKQINRKFNWWGATFQAGNIKRLDLLVYLIVEKYKADIEKQIKSPLVHYYIDFGNGYPYESSCKVGKLGFEEIYKTIREKEHYGPFEVSQMMFAIKEYRIPQGFGIAESLKNILVKPKCVTAVDVPEKCGAYALLLGMSDESTRKNYLRAARRKKFDADATALITECCLPSGMNLADFDRFTLMKPDYKVVVFGGPDSIVYQTTSSVRNPKVIYVLLYNEHYFFINNINGFVNTKNSNNQWCEKCLHNVSKQTFARHSCQGVRCKFCKKFFDTEQERYVHQNTSLGEHKCLCGMKFYSQDCYDSHIANCNDKTHYCNLCHTITPKKKDTHICGESYCNYCKQWWFNDHRCSITTLGTKDKKANYYAYDIESTVSAEGDHEVSILVVMSLKDYSHTVYESLETFAEWVVKQKSKTILYAHNAKGYDAYLLGAYFVQKTLTTPEKIIKRGSKTMYMKVGNVSFIDSLNHFGGSLQSQVATFGLKCGDKGYFPYRFYTKENRKYVGEIPSENWFDIPEKDEDKAEFSEWYLDQLIFSYFEPYDIHRECVKYCVQDCRILAEALNVYRNGLKEITGLDPLFSITIASYAMKVYRAKFMKAGTFSILERGEYEFAKRAMQGGRTNALKFLWEVRDEDLLLGKYIDYIDVVSLYPTVQRYDDMPVGTPTIEHYDALDAQVNSEIVANCFGLVECDIVPPKDLRLPLLLQKQGGKLVETLEDMTKVVYTSVELQKAISLGYQITRVYCIHRYTRSNEAFAEYVETFIRVKKENDNNPGKKAIAKMMLNSLWGKFGQNDDMTFCKYFTDPAEWYNLVKRENKKEVLISGVEGDFTFDLSVIFAKFEELNKKHMSLTNTNMTVAAFTTANARVRLYNEMSRIGIDRLLYHDTDSIVYIRDPAGYNTVTGNELGMFKLENKTPIVKYCALGPKTWSYVESSGYTSTKSKGYSVSKLVLRESEKPREGDFPEKLTTSMRKIKYDVYKTLLDDAFGSDGKLKISSKRLKPLYENMTFQRSAGKIKTILATKCLQFEYNKRTIVSLTETLPFGYSLY